MAPNFATKNTARTRTTRRHTLTLVRLAGAKAGHESAANLLRSVTPVALLGAKLGELHINTKNLLFSHTPVGTRGARYQKEGPSDCGQVVGLREEPAEREQEPNTRPHAHAHTRPRLRK